MIASREFSMQQRRIHGVLVLNLFQTSDSSKFSPLQLCYVFIVSCNVVVLSNSVLQAFVGCVESPFDRLCGRH